MSCDCKPLNTRHAPSHLNIHFMSQDKISNNEIDFKQLSETLILCYVKGCVSQARKLQSLEVLVNSAKNMHFISSVSNILVDLKKYSFHNSLEKALETIDVAKIYKEVDRLEADENQEVGGSETLGYEDFIVKAALKYFKEEFFEWVNQPMCPVCKTDAEVSATGSKGPPLPNPDEISVIELFQCGKCKLRVEFPRINNPEKLLETRKGRCGEWVNCFILILKSLVPCQVRYIWNAEDHVWCEYYSKSMKRWVHLDPCENAYDEPTLYCENWRKKMSWVIGIGEYYICDLSSKYITTDSERLRKSEVANEATVKRFLEKANASLLLKAWRDFVTQCHNEDEAYHKLYTEVLLVKEQELRRTTNRHSATKLSTKLGRQTGSAQWTASRGENGRT